MQRRFGSCSPLARLSVALVAISAAGCTSTVLVTPQYHPTGINLPLGAGDGILIRLIVIDDRADQLHLGITEDTYKEEIQLAESAADLVEETFGALLSQAGFLISDQVRTTYRVRIRNVTTVGAWSFGARARASVSLEVRVLAGDQDLGGKLVLGNATAPVGAAASPAVACSQALSIALSQAIERAVSDVQLSKLAKDAALADSAGGDTVHGGEKGAESRAKSAVVQSDPNNSETGLSAGPARSNKDKVEFESVGDSIVMTSNGPMRKTTGRIASLSKEEIVLGGGSAAKTYAISDSTKFLDSEGKPTDRATFAKGDLVTVTKPLKGGSEQIVEVRKGPMKTSWPAPR